ncbi:SagB/ThcOx family dehydrogenase [Sphaerisporangium corydalis]|uniref:SagB family peptide dehydrogenase n=1 Tax=Sphaerisporangium corydalis TaxID=1441875 RepID=A0ABV9E9R1_9ACTN|nr:SagB family peptide dehydrogenase [Sphaerisporangium corydalis]
MSAEVMAAVEEVLSLRPGVFLATIGGELLLLRRGLSHHSEAFGAPGAVKRAVLDLLARGACTTGELLAVGGPGEVPAFLGTLRAGGWIVTTVRHRGRDLYTMQPLCPESKAPEALPPDLVLSRFTVMRREGDGLVVESPLARARMLVHDARVMSLIGALVLPASPYAAPDSTPDAVAGSVPEAIAASVPVVGSVPVAVAGSVPDAVVGSVPDVVRRALPDAVWGALPDAAVRRVVRDLFRAGLVVAASGETGRDVEQWRPHELWFHARSRMGDGGYSGGFGRTTWAKGLHESLPARREPYPGPVVDLYRPDMATLRVSDRPLTAVVEERRSIREHDDEAPITADQLGELLYRCARVRHSFTREGVEYVSRPHPSGGSTYELELYPVVRRAAGLDPGMYHYDPHDHRLRLVRGPEPSVGRLLRTATSAAMMQAPPQVLLVVAARFGRLMLTYEELPYSLVLKHVGVLYQTMYLVATSMGLAACGLGAGEAGAFTEATGADYLTESSVGEFLLGSRPRDPSPDTSPERQNPPPATSPVRQNPAPATSPERPNPAPGTSPVRQNPPPATSPERPNPAPGTSPVRQNPAPATSHQGEDRGTTTAP